MGQGTLQSFFEEKTLKGTRGSLVTSMAALFRSIFDMIGCPIFLRKLSRVPMRIFSPKKFSWVPVSRNKPNYITECKLAPKLCYYSLRLKSCDSVGDRPLATTEGTSATQWLPKTALYVKHGHAARITLRVTQATARHDSSE